MFEKRNQQDARRRPVQPNSPQCLTMALTAFDEALCMYCVLRTAKSARGLSLMVGPADKKMTVRR
jgi:hypothetical protein